MIEKNSYQKPFLDYFEVFHSEKKVKKQDVIENLYESIKENLEKLLSTRMRAIGVYQDQSLIQASVFHYGMPDFMDIQFGSKQGETELCQKISHIIAHYEPRLKEIEVTVLDKRDAYGVLQLRIMAELNMARVGQVVVYDSEYHPMHARFLMEA